MDKRKNKRRVLALLPAWVVALSPKLTTLVILDLCQEKRKRRLADTPQAQ